MCDEQSNRGRQKANSYISQNCTDGVAEWLPLRRIALAANRGEKSIASPWDRFNEAWALTTVAQSSPKAV